MSLGTCIPAPIKNVLWHAMGRWQQSRFPTCHGLTFAATWKNLQRSRHWSIERIRAHQLASLQRIVTLAYETTDFYRELYDRAGVSPADIRTLADVRRLPIVTKDDIKRNGERMINRTIDPDRLESTFTGGSTGEPTRLVRIRHDDLQVELAYILRQWHEAGYRHGDKILTLRGGRLADEHYRNGIAVKFDERRNAMCLSPIDLSADNYEELMRTIDAFAPDVIEAFPSALHWLSRAIEAAGDVAPAVKAIFLESESIVAGTAEGIQRVWRARTWGGYGNSERSADAVQCGRSRDYHVNYEYGLVELVAADGSVIDSPDRSGDMVTTGFGTDAMPLIRYNTLDRARWAEDTPCPCGRAGERLAMIEGRREDFFVTRGGALVCTSAVNIHTPALDGLVQFQLEQHRAGELVFHYVPMQGAQVDPAALAEALAEQLGDDIDIQCRAAERFDRTARGKLRLLTQHLDLTSYMK